MATGVFRAMSRARPSVIGHADRVGPMSDYCTGLMMPCERKSVEPLAAVTAPAGRRPSINRCCICRPGFMVGREGAGEGVRAVLPAIERLARSRPGSSTTPAFRRRASTRSGWRGNIAASWASRTTARRRWLSIANRRASLPVRYRLYLPQEWADDAARRRKATCPRRSASRPSRNRPGAVRSACEADLPRGVVLLDAGYGIYTQLRAQSAPLG